MGRYQRQRRDNDTMNTDERELHAAAVLLAACAGTAPTADDVREKIIWALGEGFVSNAGSQYLGGISATDFIGRVRAYAIGRLSVHWKDNPGAPRDEDARDLWVASLIDAVLETSAAHWRDIAARVAGRKAGAACFE
jgi:hypothetical protein